MATLSVNFEGLLRRAFRLPLIRYTSVLLRCLLYMHMGWHQGHHHCGHHSAWQKEIPPFCINAQVTRLLSYHQRFPCISHVWFDMPFCKTEYLVVIIFPYTVLTIVWRYVPFLIFVYLRILHSVSTVFKASMHPELIYAVCASSWQQMRILQRVRKYVYSFFLLFGSLPYRKLHKSIGWKTRGPSFPLSIQEIMVIPYPCLASSHIAGHEECD